MQIDRLLLHLHWRIRVPARRSRIAVDTVRGWLDANPKADMHVIFDVYTEKDEQTYRAILGE